MLDIVNDPQTDRRWRVVPCPSCGGSEADLLLMVRVEPPLVGSGRLVQCRRCRFVWLNPQPTEEILVEAYPAEEYYAYRYVETICGGRSFYSRLTDWLRRGAVIAATPALLRQRPWWIRPLLWMVTVPARQRFRGIPRRAPGRLLDVGCGDGAFGTYHRQVGWQVYGVEFHPAGAARARANGLDVYEGSFLTGDLPWRDFDVVRLWHVLEHLPEPRRALAKAHDLLIPGGELIIGVPNLASPYRKVLGARWAAIQAPQHLIHFTSDTLRRMVTDAGFADIRIRNASVGTGLSSLAALCPRSWAPVVMNPAARAASIVSDLLLDAVGWGDGLEMRARRPGASRCASSS